MKILWTVNLVPMDVADHLGIQTVVLGGWVESMAARLRKFEGLELAIACKTEKDNKFDTVVNGVRYFSMGYDAGTSL
ncbi:MAG: hypothetical protein MJ141_05890, partial [Clostridia bacterium]|nr:hypothetical protein [Clostridia bacterium]